MDNTSHIAKNQTSHLFIGLVILDITLLIISSFLHIIGVFLMSKLKRPKNIHHILIQLSISEISIQVFRFASAIYVVRYDNYEEQLGYQVTRTLTVQGLCVSYVLIMIMVALDPLLIVVLKLNYQSFVTKQRTQLLLGLCWFIGLVYGGLNFVFTYKTREKISITFTFPIVTTLFIVFSVASYSMIYKAVRKQAKSIARVSVSNMKSNAPSLRFRVPVLITLTFFLFCLSPSIIQVIVGYQISKEFLLSLGISFNVGFVADALIYMLLHPMVKGLLMNFIYRRKNITSIRNISTRSASSPRSDRLETKKL
eukprot:TCONS_00020732-protein